MKLLISAPDLRDVKQGLWLGLQTIGFSICLSSVITLLWKGGPILVNGVPVCAVVIPSGNWTAILHSICGCSLAVIGWFGLSLLGLVILTPRTWTGFKTLWQQHRARLNPK